MQREETRVERLVYVWCFVAVYAAAFGSLLWLWISSGAGAVGEFATLGVTSLVLFGKFIIFAPDPLHGPWSLALMVWLIDLLIALALASGLERFEGAPVLGKWLRRARTRAVQVLTEYPRLERMAFFGVAIFVLLPIATTGAVSGSFAARLLGLSRLAGVLAIAFGSAGTAVVFAFAAVFLGEKAEAIFRSPVLAAAMGIGLAVLGWIMFQRVKAVLRR